MSIIVFIIILSVLVLVHELGHFLAAKMSGMKVWTFAIGFQPTILSKKWGETTYKINALPFGGYVRIHGESDLDPNEDQDRMFKNKSKTKQLFVLLAGITMNFLLALFLMIIISGIARPTVLSDQEIASGLYDDMQTVALSVIPGSPADIAGIPPGAVISTVNGINDPTPEQISEITKKGEPVNLQYTVGEKVVEEKLLPVKIDDTNQSVIGISTGVVATIPGQNFWQSIKNGTQNTINITKSVVTGLVGLLTGKVGFDGLTGPIGLVEIVGEASRVGLVSLLFLTAVISVNLAILNLLPIPGLDGGRVFLVLLELIRGKKFTDKAVGIVNMTGFALLILITIFVTIQDIIRL